MKQQRHRDNYPICNGSDEMDAFDKYDMYMAEWEHQHHRLTCRRLVVHPVEHDQSLMEWYVDRESRLYPVYTFTVGAIEVNLRGYELEDAAKITITEWKSAFKVKRSVAVSVHRKVNWQAANWRIHDSQEYMERQGKKDSTFLRNRASAAIRWQREGDTLRQSLANAILRGEATEDTHGGDTVAGHKGSSKDVGGRRQDGGRLPSREGEEWILGVVSLKRFIKGRSRKTTCVGGRA